MTIMTIHIPNDVKEALDKALEGEDKDAIIAQFIRDGLAARGIKVETEAEDLAERRRKAVDTILELRKTMPAISQEEIRAMREELRR
jgi:hypothetical protein